MKCRRHFFTERMVEMKAYETRFREGLPSLVVQNEYVTDIEKVSNPEQIYHLFHEVLKLQLRTEEYVYLVGLNTKGFILGVFEVAHGNASSCALNGCGIFQRLLLVGATGFVVIHNHPSGDPTPSGADLEATERLKKQAELMEIAMLDHIIIGGDTFYSIFAKGGGN